MPVPYTIGTDAVDQAVAALSGKRDTEDRHQVHIITSANLNRRRARQRSIKRLA